MKIFPLLSALVAGTIAALLIWVAGIFVFGEYYSFLSRGDALSSTDASFTRFNMLGVFLFTSFIVYAEKS
jgi:hypothetical protein